MVYVPIHDLQVNKANPRVVRDGAFKKLKESLQGAKGKEMFEARPCIVSNRTGENIIIAGNTRFKAAKELKWQEVPAVIMEGLTEEQEQEIIIRDNVTNGEWDWETLANEWDAVKLEEWGVDLPEMTELEAEEAAEDDYEMPEEVKTDIVLGDLFTIGEHRLLCGDSTSATDTDKLMQEDKADVAFNDPPYGMKKEKEGVHNDNLNYSDLLEFNRQWIPLQFLYIKENGSWYCWGIDEPLMDIYSELIKPMVSDQKATFRNLLTWDKGNGQGQNSENTRSYAIADEKCLFVMCGVQGFNNNADNYYGNWEPIRQYLETEIKKLGDTDSVIAKALGYKDGRTVNHWWSKSQWSFPTEGNYEALRKYAKTKKIDALKKEYEVIKKEYEVIKKEYYSTRAYFNNTHDNFNNVWKFERHRRRGDEGGHATPKPIPLCARAIESSCPKEGLVIDFFLGSGSTMVAAHQLGRKCYGMELDHKYCQVIIDRMRKLDPGLVITRNGELYV